MEKEKALNILVSVLVGVIVLLALMFVLNSARKDGNTKDERLNGTYWACNGLVCNRFYTPQEWVNKYCGMQDGQPICRVKTAQGDYIYPMNALNVSAIRECAEFICLQEVLVRNASYILPAQ